MTAQRRAERVTSFSPVLGAAAAPSTCAETLCVSQALAPTRPPLPPSPYPALIAANTGDSGLSGREAKLCAGHRLLRGFRRVPRWQALGETAAAGTGEAATHRRPPGAAGGLRGPRGEPCSGPCIRYAIALIGTPLAMAYPQKTLPTRRIDFQL